MLPNNASQLRSERRIKQRFDHPLAVVRRVEETVTMLQWEQRKRKEGSEEERSILRGNKEERL